MVQVAVHIGPPGPRAVARSAEVFAQREALAAQGVLVPVSPGKRGHAKLFLACLDPDHADPLRQARGLDAESSPARLYERLHRALQEEIARCRPQRVILSAPRLVALSRPSERRRLRSLLSDLSDDVRLYLDEEPWPDIWSAHVRYQLFHGRTAPLHFDLHRLAGSRHPDDVLAESDTLAGAVNAPPPWLRTHHLRQAWKAESVTMLDAGMPEDSLEVARPTSSPATTALVALDASAETLARTLKLNRALTRRNLALSRVRRSRTKAALTALHSDGPGLDLASIQRWCDTNPAAIRDPLPDTEFDIGPAMQILFPNVRPARKDKSSPPKPLRLDKVEALRRSRFAPHDALDPGDSALPPFSAVAQPQPDCVIVACMKDEAPYILEWIAHHRAIGVSHFIIFTNGCSDPTVQILEQLQRLGVVTHVDNNAWKGKSPQQAALNRAVHLDRVTRADWVAHIDVDEFINIRTGHGTLADLVSALPEGTTNVAMTWRLFGNSDVEHIGEAPVTAQFLQCAPSYCPKPHTMWGFKTLSRVNGLYAKLSCHRPNQPLPERLDEICWVNGSGEPMGDDIALRGWRSNVSNIGYSLVQLNHYALRSRDSFVIKRARGRALHVDRTIGKNYWVRMDWNICKEASILRHAPRMRSEVAILRSDAELSSLEAEGLAWHRAKAEELRAQPAYAALLNETRGITLSALERSALALALDHET